MNHCWWTSSAPASRCSKMPQFLGGQSPFTIIVMMYIYIYVYHDISTKQKTVTGIMQTPISLKYLRQHL
jgi:hypothetical protein